MAKTTQKLKHKENINNPKKLLVDNNFQTYQIPQLEKWKNLLNKEIIDQNKISNKITKRKKIIKNNKKLTRKNKKFLGIF